MGAVATCVEPSARFKRNCVCARAHVYIVLFSFFVFARAFEKSSQKYTLPRAFVDLLFLWFAVFVQ